ncbi:MAG: hypothetical protein AAFR96_10415 [Planctomycetota bacterium]
MSSSFDGDDLFGSGPHRFQEGRGGWLVLPDESSGVPSTRNLIFGEFELRVFVFGRLLAASDAALWQQRDAIATAIDDLAVATLVDQNGKSWSDMTLVRVEWAEQVDRGRRVSIGYEARFHRFSPP